MDVFRFHNPTSPTKMEQGEIINGLKSKMWVEKYRDTGEFTFVADASSGAKEKLPIGSFVSHVDTHEIMAVENHEISDVKGKPTEIIITGSGFEEAVFGQRIVGMNQSFPAGLTALDYPLVADETWNQVVTLIKGHIYASDLIDDDNAVPYITIMTDIMGSGDSVARSIKRGVLQDRVLEILDIDDLGIRTVRPGPWSPLGSSSPNVAVVVHVGFNKSSEIIFSYDAGEIESAEYLWSNKRLKNAALITGRWIETWIDNSSTGYDRRVMHIDGSDIDGVLTEAPVEPVISYIVAVMQQRANDILAAQKDVALTKAEVSSDANNSTYRLDYNVGDIVTVHGDYNELSFMRVTEYVEIEDENGLSGYPTLTLI